MPAAAKLGAAVLTLALGAFGALAADALSVPAPFLTGPALVVSVAAVAGVRVIMIDALRVLCFVTIGVGLGTGITPETMGLAARWPLSLAVLAAGLVAVMLAGRWVMGRLFAMDRRTALLATAPGHLSFVLALGADVRADLAQISVVQSLRVLALTLLVPLVVAIFTDADLTMRRLPGAPMALPALAVTMALALALGAVLTRLRVPAGWLLAGMSVSAGGHLAGAATGAVPPWLALPAFTLMGTLIGTRFAGTSRRALLTAATGALVSTGLAVTATVIGALVVSHVLGLRLTDVLIAFAPGGLETMAAMAVMLDADPAYVAVHHVARLLVLTVALPVMLGRRG